MMAMDSEALSTVPGGFPVPILEISMPSLATRFAKNRHTIQSNEALSDAEIRRVVPSIFAEDKHASRSERYTHIPTAEVLSGLRREGFEPFMATQSRTRDASKREHTKHMLRLRHPSQARGSEVNEVILINSHDGSSCYQMLAGVFRFVCANGLIYGDAALDVRVPHKGPVIDQVVGGAFEVLDGLTRVIDEREVMKGVSLNQGEQAAFARAALALRFDTESGPAPVTETQVLRARRSEDRANDLWTTFNRVQENLLQGGLRGRSLLGKQTSTRAVVGIDQGVKLNRALWVLADEMRKLRG